MFGTAYFNLHNGKFTLMHNQAYFSIFTLIMPSKAISLINIHTAAGAQRERCFFHRLDLPSFSASIVLIRL